MLGRHAVLRKELFAHRRELALWMSWGLLVAGVNVAIVWYGGYLVVSGRASVGDLMAFQWYTLLLMSPVRNIVNSFSELRRSLAAMERVFEVLGTAADKPDRPSATAAPSVVTEIRFEGVEFEYAEGRPVIRVRCRRAERLSRRARGAEQGREDNGDGLGGAGPRPHPGRILVNGTDIRDFRLRTHRALLALVQQGVFLFDGSVRDNIVYGRPDASDAEVEDAARWANAYEFIAKLADGYGTVVGERSVRLPGGQQQRVGHRAGDPGVPRSSSWTRPPATWTRRASN